jgi:uncharacterized protein (DUF2062 family)
MLFAIGGAVAVGLFRSGVPLGLAVVIGLVLYAATRKQ